MAQPGSDAAFGWHPLGQFVHGLECPILAGISHMKVLQVATGVTAHALGIDDVTGTLEAGKAADLLMVDGDPTRAIKAVAKVQAVFLEGVRVKSPRTTAGGGYGPSQQSPDYSGLHRSV